MEKRESGYKILILGNRCYRCGHEWRPISIEEKPTVCPKCKSPYWDKPRKNRSRNNEISYKKIRRFENKDG